MSGSVRTDAGCEGEMALLGRTVDRTAAVMNLVSWANSTVQYSYGEDSRSMARTCRPPRRDP